MADENVPPQKNEEQAAPEVEPEAPAPEDDIETPEPDAAELALELEKARAVIAQQEIRARADIENARRRNERDMQNARKFAIEKVITELLPVVDSMEMALQVEEQSIEKLTEGVSMTLKMFTTALEAQGVEILDPTGEPFDPNFHEAMTMLPSDEFPPNTVTQVFQKGYLLNERVVRPAKVIVSKEAT